VKPEELDRLIHRYYERDLTPEEEALLWALVRTDRAAADRFVELTELESGLVESLHAEEAAPPEVSTPLRTTRRRTQVLRAPTPRPVWPLFFAAGLMVGFVALLLRSAERPSTPDTARRPDPVFVRPEPAAPPAPPMGRPAPRPAERTTPVDDWILPVLQPKTVAAPAPVQPAPETPKPEERREPAPRPNPAERTPAVTDVKVAEAKIEKVEGEVVRIPEGAVAAGQGLPSGQGLEVRKGSALLALADGTKVELRAGTRLERMVLAADQKRFELTRGAAASTVVKQPEKTSVVFQTPHAEVTVIGTRLSVEIMADGTRVEVQEGRVRCTRISDRYSLEIPAGRHAVARKGPAPVARPTPVLRSFQDGVLPTPDYAGTRDTWISSAQPTLNFATADQLRLQRLSEGRAALIRWDTSSIPSGSRVMAAELSFWVTGKIVGDCKVFDLRQAFEEGEATWRLAAAGRPWRVQGVQHDGSDRGTRPIGLLAPPMPVMMYTMPLNEWGVGAVQEWVNNPRANFGILILGPDANEWGLDSREVAAPERRPKLTVTYLPAK
jgi:hypothetical protein